MPTREALTSGVLELVVTAGPIAKAILVILAIAIRLIPVVFQAVWHVMPGVLIMLLIVSVLRGIVNRLLG